ncbi:MAG: HAMP domain-containing sensor histidine kinase [Bacteroidota bacterium]
MNTFRINIAIRVLLIGLSTMIFVYLVFQMKRYIGATLFAVMGIGSVISLWYYVEKTNRKLIRFFDAVRFDDFEMSFTGDSQLGATFKKLNISFNQVLDAFREARAQSEESRQYLHTSLQNIPTGVISFTSDGRVTLCNPSARKLLDIPLIESLSALTETHPDLLPRMEILRESDTRMLYQPESQKKLLLSSSKVRLRGKEYVLVSIQNIQEELEQNEVEAWQTLASTLRHEIINSVTPITSISHTLSDLLQDKLEAPFDTQTLSEELAGDVKESLTTIQNRGKALIRFVNEYKSLTQIPVPELASTQVDSLLKEVITLLKPQAEEKGVQLSHHAQGISPIQADKDLLEMALINLLKNAIEATRSSENPRVVLSAEEGEEELFIHIQDNGKGIAPQALEKIFIPFYSTKTKEGGTGIGLSITRKIILLHKGKIEVTSTLGEGSLFTLRFPKQS